MFDPARSGLSRPPFVLPSKNFVGFSSLCNKLSSSLQAPRGANVFFSLRCIHESREIWQLRISPVERQPDSRAPPFILSTWEFWTKYLCPHGAKITLAVPQMPKNFPCIAILSFNFLAPYVHVLCIYYWSCPPLGYCFFFLYVIYFLQILNTAAKQPFLTALPPKQ